MKDIDFLPIRYRERHVQRRARVWRLLMFCCLAGFVVIVAAAQHALHRRLERQLAAVNLRHPEAVSLAARAAQLQQETAEADALAGLYTYLQHPWPVSQLLSEVAVALPDSIVLGEIKLESSAGPGSAPSATPPPSTPPASRTEAAARDLERLRAAQDPLTFTLYLSGRTTNTPQLHQFVRRLAPTPLFQAAKLETLEATRSEGRVTESRFEVRLFIRPGFGQPSGPTQPAGTETVVLTAEVRRP